VAVAVTIVAAGVGAVVATTGVSVGESSIGVAVALGRGGVGFGVAVGGGAVGVGVGSLTDDRSVTGRLGEALGLGVAPWHATSESARQTTAPTATRIV